MTTIGIEMPIDDEHLWKRINLSTNTYVADLNAWDNWAIEWKNRLVTVLHAQNSGQNWEVSNVNRALSTRYNNRMYLIRIRHLSSGTPTGREWLLSINGPWQIASNNYRAYFSETWGSSAYSTYWQLGRDSATNRHGFWGLWYHKGGNLTRTDNSQPNTFALDYTSGDLAAPTVPTNGNFYANSASDFALFFPHV